jgi:hypothetical protein
MRKGNSSIRALAFSGALVLASTSFGQTETLSTALCGCQPTAGSPCPSATNWLLYNFAYNITSGCPSFTALNNFTTSGTYVAGDILNFKLYVTNFSVFNTTSLVATITTGLGPGAHSFTGFNQTTCATAQRYYWITMDVSVTAVAGHTIRVDLITAAMTAITGTENYGTNVAPAYQTICSPAPVSLISFAGKNNDGKNQLEWITASETNNDYFTIERSADGSAFSPIAVITGQGNSSMEHRYAFTDDAIPANEVTYYRLKQTDFNGEFKYVGGILALNNSPPESSVLISIDVKKIRLGNLTPGASWTVCDLWGRVLFSGIYTGECEIDLSVLPAGVYLILVRDENSVTARKFMLS